MHSLHKHSDCRRDPRPQNAAGGDVDHFRATYRDAAYYSTGRDWKDYAPAYRYGLAAFLRHRGKRFEQIERMLEQHWNEVRPPSRLVWVEARGAVRDAWQQAMTEAPHQDHASAAPHADRDGKPSS